LKRCRFFQFMSIGLCGWLVHSSSSKLPSIPKRMFAHLSAQWGLLSQSSHSNLDTTLKDENLQEVSFPVARFVSIHRNTKRKMTGIFAFHSKRTSGPFLRLFERRGASHAEEKTWV